MTMTKTEAADKIAALRADPTWVARYTQGGLAEQRELTDLMKVAHASSAAPEISAKEQASERIKALRGDPDFTASYLRGAANETAELTALMKAAHGEVAAPEQK